MPEPKVEEAKEEVVEASPDEKDKEMDKVLDDFEKEAPSESSTEKETTGKENSKEPSGSDQRKPDEDKPKEEEIPKEFHKNPAWQRILKERDEAKAKAVELERKGSLSDDDKKLLEDAKTITSSREGIETLMRAQGFKNEAINKRLAEAGHDVASPENDVALVCKEHGMDEKTLKKGQREDIEDYCKVARTIFKSEINKVLNSELKPIQEHIGKQSQKESASTITNQMKAIVAKDEVDGKPILDFEKDIEPAINEYLDKNPEATQEEVFVHFKAINHELTVKRLKTSKSQEGRDKLKENLRQNAGGGIKIDGVPKKTGNFHEDADALLDSLNIS